MRKLASGSAVAIMLAVLSTSAEAHTFGLHGAGFASGFVHPLSGLDHLLAMVTVGIWAAQRGGKAIWLMPLTFMTAMLAGGVLGMLQVGLPAVELGIAASLVLFGSLVALALRPALGVGMLMVSTFAVFHGHAHGLEMPEASIPVMYAVGFIAATALLHAIGVGVAYLSLMRGGLKNAGNLFLRMAGGAVAGYGLLVAVS
jgi:urease accessory protein